RYLGDELGDVLADVLLSDDIAKQRSPIGGCGMPTKIIRTDCQEN
ncbi:MAG: hypothetical protein ACI9SB_001619, partial [Candidatus Azotimanducaceae bacterium]